jgi:hypothetical protein
MTKAEARRVRRLEVGVRSLEAIAQRARETFERTGERADLFAAGAAAVRLSAITVSWCRAIRRATRGEVRPAPRYPLAAILEHLKTLSVDERARIACELRNGKERDHG